MLKVKGKAAPKDMLATIKTCRQTDCRLRELELDISNAAGMPNQQQKQHLMDRINGLRTDTLARLEKNRVVLKARQDDLTDLQSRIASFMEKSGVMDPSGPGSSPHLDSGAL